MSDIMTLKHYFSHIPNEAMKQDARFAMLMLMIVRSSEGYSVKTRKGVKFEDMMKSFDWLSSLDGPTLEELLKAGKRKPDNISLQEWCKIRTEKRRLNKLYEDLGLELVA